MIRRLLQALILSTVFALSAGANDRPNILYIMSDDHAAHAIGAYGGRLAELDPTPTIDRLAKEGMLFQNAFCTNSICSPSRASVLTGQYPHTHGVYDLWGGIPSERQYLPIEIKKAGYETAMIGKWHLKEEPGAFDYYAVLPGQGDYHGPTFRIRGEKKWGENTIEFPDKHSSDAITDLTLEWLESRRDSDEPFFLMHHYKAPHDYFEHAERYNDHLADLDIPEPPNLWQENQPEFGSIATRGYNDELVPHIGTSIGDRNPRRSYSKDLPRLFPQDYPEDYDPENLSAEEVTRLAYNVYLKKYLRCVKGIDDNLARLFAYLEETGELDNTVIVYTGDQGFMLGEHDYQDKRWMYEESMRMPFLIRYPKLIKAGSVTDAIIENVDFGPTLLGFAGLETPDYMQGSSFQSICETGQEPEGWKQEAYYRYWMHMAHHDNPGHVGIRTKEHKLIFYYGCRYDGSYQTPPAWEFYDLTKDPQENRNEYNNPEYAELIASLKDRLAQRRAEIGDDGADYPVVEKVIADFWDYDGEDRARAIEISSAFRATREEELRSKRKSWAMTTLFDGSNLDAWEFGEGAWSIADDGSMTCHMTTRKGKDGKEQQVGMGYIWTAEDYAHFELKLEYKLTEGANSGVFFRTDPNNPVQGGFEIQLMDTPGFAAAKGREVEAKKANGSFYDALAPSSDPGKPIGEWNTLVLSVRGDLLTLKMNGQEIISTDISQWTTPNQNPDGSPNKFKTALADLPMVGRIGFQNHGQQVWFRNIQIRRF